MKKYRVKVNGTVYEVELEAVEENDEKIEVRSEKAGPANESAAASILAPIAGKVLQVKVNVGDTVRKGQTVAVIEAMKLENEIQSAYDGRVARVAVAPGDDVRNKDVLIVLE